ncbi:tetratricopeptide repeat protein [Pseudomonas viridiflava]|uniref:tetratricopeptide repeat protein n=2 Tax=Pseudomonas viridiflava TaxID=33069 RepID=UPI000F03CE24|nr:tetratricopeptide repeat protein [Pseudomonas viridiflava]MEE4070415.1 tetratricopeptide repeat protein [Pseudomonas viridiflava]
MNNKISSCSLFLILSSLLISPVVANEKIANGEVAKIISVDLVPSFTEQKIVITKRDSGAEVLATGNDLGKSVVFFKSDKLLPNVKNKYSPASFDGFNITFLKDKDKMISAIDAQGEISDYVYDKSSAKGVLNLVTKEEDNTSYVFNIQFQYDEKLKEIRVRRVVYVTANESCDKSVLSAYLLGRTSLEGKAVVGFDGSEAFDYLKKLHLNFQSGRQETKKLMPSLVEININNALSAYKKGDKKELNESMDSLLADGGGEEICPPERYIVQRYYFKDRVAWTNDVGFLFSESGHYAEAVELLRRVVLENPDRMVAYLNLADAYWGMGKKAEAKESYQNYYDLMLAAGKKVKVPERVSMRITENSN